MARYNKQKERSYYIKQRISGAVMAAIGIMMLFMLDGDATFSFLTLPLGIFLVFTKEKVMAF